MTLLYKELAHLVFRLSVILIHDRWFIQHWRTSTHLTDQLS